MTISAAEYKAFARYDFHTFIHRAFKELNPKILFLHTWHNELIAAKLEACLRGEIKRLIINVPPRSLKSHADAFGDQRNREWICLPADGGGLAASVFARTDDFSWQQIRRSG
jgi:hypothetical protein